MRFRRTTLFIFTLLVLGTGIFYIEYQYLYNPLNFPGGNLIDFGRRWTDFKKPLNIEGYSWENGNRTIYAPIENNINITRLVVNSFAKFEELDNYNYEQYMAKLPKVRGKEYTILVRENQRNRKDILLVFTFYENSNVAEIDGAHFYSITEDFKKTIIDNLK